MISLKRGDRFTISCKFTPSSGSPDLTGVGVLMWVRSSSGTKLAELPITLTNAAAGEYTAYIDSAGWPIGMVNLDIRYTFATNDTRATNTIALQVLASVSDAPGV